MQTNHSSKALREQDVAYVALRFVDLFGATKQVTVHLDEWDSVMEGEKMIDGSSIAGFSDVDSSELTLRPDLTTLHIERGCGESGARHVAAVYCDVYELSGHPAPGCTRSMLQRAQQRSQSMGYSLQVGIEGEFFLFELDERGHPSLRSGDEGGYCDVFPLDRGDEVRMAIMDELSRHGFRLEAGHHEVAPGQHEINFRFGEALQIADRWQSFKLIVRRVAKRHGMYASFIPKPFSGRNGNAMHCNLSLRRTDGSNAFCGQDGESSVSDTAGQWIAGLLRHAAGIAAIANPTVNSYKRLLPGFEAPTRIAWSRGNRTAAIRVPGASGSRSRAEYRPPDPTANPYLLFAVMLQAGLDGLDRAYRLPPEAIGNLYDGTDEDGRVIEQYPRDLNEAVARMREDAMVRQVMGETAFARYVAAKQAEADDFAAQVHSWEVAKYL